MIISAIVTLVITGFLGYYSKTKVKNTKDFISAGGGVGIVGITGAIMGAIIGGASTVGTAQMGFIKGISAIWFILGLCGASILLGFFYGKLIELRQFETIPQIIAHAYGKKAQVIASILLSLGMFIHINGQVIACRTLFSTVFDMKGAVATGIVVILLVIYVVFGGFWGSTMIGILKTILLYSTSMLVAGFIILKFDGINVIKTGLTEERWYNIFSGGVVSDTGSFFATVAGVLSTQIYLQTAMASKNVKTLKYSGFITAMLVLPVGMVCTMIGMFMRVKHPGIIPADAFPEFVVNYIPSALAGVILATVLISSLATGAGLTLGVATIFTRDLYKTFINKKADDRNQMLFMRLVIVIIGTIVFAVVVGSGNSMILNFGFVSMIFRATPIFIPVMTALHFKNKVSGKIGTVGIVLAPVVSGIWIALGYEKISAIYIGMAVSIMIFSYGMILSKKTRV